MALLIVRGCQRTTDCLFHASVSESVRSAPKKLLWKDSFFMLQAAFS